MSASGESQPKFGGNEEPIILLLATTGTWFSIATGLYTLAGFKIEMAILTALTTVIALYTVSKHLQIDQ